MPSKLHLPIPTSRSPWQPLVRFLSLSLTPPAASRRWGPAVLVLLCLASVTGHTVFKVHPGGSVGHFKVEWRAGVQTCRSLLADASELRTSLHAWAFLTPPCRSRWHRPQRLGCPPPAPLPLGVLFLASWPLFVFMLFLLGCLAFCRSFSVLAIPLSRQYLNLLMMKYRYNRVSVI